MEDNLTISYKSFYIQLKLEESDFNMSEEDFIERLIRPAINILMIKVKTKGDK